MENISSAKSVYPVNLFEIRLMTTNTNPARGMRDFLPDAVRKRNYVIGIIREVYEKYGFEPLETPSIENLSTLTNKYGEEGDQLMFKILKRGQKLEKQLKREDAKENDLTDLALRYDLTVPLARVIANYRHELPRFFKRYQIQPVWRADRPAKGRYREFYQCDVDAIGSKSMLVEAELISAVSEILERLGFKDFAIRINHREILIGLLKAFNFTTEKYADVLTSLDKLDKIGVDGVRDELQEREVDQQASKDIIKYFDIMVGPEKLPRMPGSHRAEPNVRKIHNGMQLTHASLKSNDQLTRGISELEKIVELLGYEKDSPPTEIDLRLARGLSYYTGAIFEIVLTKGDFAGSIGGGGRYDGLIGMFGKEEVPAVGFSLGLERILYVMEERGMFPDNLRTNLVDVLVTVWNEESAGESLKLANELRQNGLRVFVYPQADKLGKQFKYADQINVEYVCVLGDNELAENTVSLKNMKTGEQETIAREEVSEKIKITR